MVLWVAVFGGRGGGEKRGRERGWRSCAYQKQNTLRNLSAGIAGSKLTWEEILLDSVRLVRMSGLCVLQERASGSSIFKGSLRGRTSLLCPDLSGSDEFL